MLKTTLTLFAWMIALSAAELLADDSSHETFDRIEIFPKDVEMKSSRDRIQFVVTGIHKNGDQVDLTRNVIYTVAGSAGVAVSPTGFARPLTSGTASLKVRLGNRSQTTTVRVSGFDVPRPVSFRDDTLPALAKAGCSGGSCHGSPHGKAGFRLSLFASDPSIDAASLVREEFGRRANPLDPDKSLLLLKPTMAVPHQGGKRLDKNGDLYKLLRDWIGEGCRVEAGLAKCVGIKVFPAANRVLRHPDYSQQFSVRAEFSDGTLRDVTNLAKFESSDENVVHVSPNGLATGRDRGEAAVIVRYLEFIEAPLLTFVRDIDGFRWNDPVTLNYIDENIDEKLRQLQYLPSEICDDEVFVRRVYLDVIGLMPTPEEVRAFMSDRKRSKLIDQLLERPEYSRFWAQKWGDLLRVSRKQIGLASVYKYNHWLRNTIATNMPYDQFAREILTASGSTYSHPAANFYRTSADTNDVMETTAQLFLGSRIQCAKCHNHPFEHWTTDNYYGMAAFFNRVQRKNSREPEEVFVWAADNGEVHHPHSGKVMKPWAPLRGELAIEATADRRVAFANWLTSRDNPFFAKVEVNRIWANVMGRGITEPFDDFRDSNPSSNAPLLDALAKDFVDHGYDRRHILRTILNSRTYQASPRPNDFNRDDVKYFSHYQPRRLTAEQLVDALGQVTGQPKQFEFVAAGTKATWLPAPDLKPHDRNKLGNVEFLKVFGQPERQSACECERGDETSLGQALQFINGSFVHDMLTSDQNRFRLAMKNGTPPQDIIGDLFLRALSRPPTKSERSQSLAYFSEQEDKNVAMEDICWAIINKVEFLFQH